MELTKRWNAGAVTNDLFFKLLGELEQQIAGLRAGASKREAAAKLRQSRAGTDVAEIRRRWNLPEEMGGTPAPAIARLVASDEDTEARQARQIDQLRRETLS